MSDKLKSRLIVAALSGAIGGGLLAGLSLLTIRSAALGAVAGTVSLPVAEYVSSWSFSATLKSVSFGLTLGIVASPLGAVLLQGENFLFAESLPIFVGCLVGGFIWKFGSLRWTALPSAG